MSDLYFVRVSALGERQGPDVLISARGREPALVCDGVGYALSWTDVAMDDDGLIYFQRLDARGYSVG